MESLINGYCRFLGQGVQNKPAVISYTVAALVVLFTAISPLHNYYKDHKQDFIQQRDLLVWLQEHRDELDLAAVSALENRAGGLPSDQDGKTLVTLLSETAGDSALLLTQIEQRQSSVTVSIENQSFSGVFNWLRLLSIKHDVIIGQATMTYFDSDRVNARIELNFTQ